MLEEQRRLRGIDCWLLEEQRARLGIDCWLFEEQRTLLGIHGRMLEEGGSLFGIHCRLREEHGRRSRCSGHFPVAKAGCFDTSAVARSNREADRDHLPAPRLLPPIKTTNSEIAVIYFWTVRTILTSIIARPCGASRRPAAS
jgi:hypothetical protein